MSLLGSISSSDLASCDSLFIPLLWDPTHLARALVLLLSGHTVTAHA